MTFYQKMQLSTAECKRNIRESHTPKEKYKNVCVLIAKDISCVAFAILFVSVFTLLFGSANSNAAVVIFCILLTTRFVHYGYRMQDNLRNMAIIYLIFALFPTVAIIFPPILRYFIHFFALITILVMACDEPQMGNCGLYGFCYVFLTGAPVSGRDFYLRVIEMLVGYLLCALILYHNHQKKEIKRTFQDVLKEGGLHNKKFCWQLRIALGVSTCMLIADLMHLPRTMWVGLACVSVMSPYTDDTKSRAKNRILGILIGSALFFVLHPLWPQSLIHFFGPLSGLCVGICATYRWSTVFNCFGALLSATTLYGLYQAVPLRIFNNIFGCLYGVFFAWIFTALINRINGNVQTDSIG